MNVSFIGSSNLSIFKNSILELFSFEGEDINIENEGVISFFNKIKQNEEFAIRLSNSDLIFIDLLSDVNAPKENFDIIQSSYQDLIWHLYSISPHCQIILVNSFLKDFYDFKFLKIINNLFFDSCLYMKPFISKKQSKDSKQVKNLISEVLNIKNKSDDIKKSKKLSEKSSLDLIIKKLKNKKEFETITNKV